MAKKAEKDEICRAYELKCLANFCKFEDILELLPHYRKAATNLAPAQWFHFFQNGTFNNQIPLSVESLNDKKKSPKNKTLPEKPLKKNYPNKKKKYSHLSARFLQTCQYQIVTSLDSFIENRKNDFVDIAMRSSLSDETKMILCYINKYDKWFAKNIKIQKKPIPGELIKLARKIFKHVLSLHNKPTFKHINMNLDAKVAKLSASDDTHFDYWIQLSTLIEGRTICLPLQSNHYFDSQPGKIANFVQVNIDRWDHSIHINLIKKTTQEKYKPITEKLALDIGLKILFATNKGDLLGRKFFDVLKKYDILITKLASARQAMGLRVRSTKYDLLISNLKEYLKNEINRCINKIINIYQPKILVVENLNFTKMGLSKRFIRLLNRFGLGIITKKLESLEEKFGIVIEYVNPAYTSQQCSSCGYVSKTNRKTRDKFVCEYCRKQIHADVGGSRNTLSRSSDKEIGIYTKKDRVLSILTERFCRERLLEAELQGKPCPSRWARDLMARNPYFNQQRWFKAKEGFSGDTKKILEKSP